MLGQQIRVNVRAGPACRWCCATASEPASKCSTRLWRNWIPIRPWCVSTCRAPAARRIRRCRMGFRILAAVLGRLLHGAWDSTAVDVLGVSWGGALAQQFAFQNPRRCRRLILVSTGTGVMMVPGRPRGAGEDADAAPVLRPRVRRLDRR